MKPLLKIKTTNKIKNINNEKFDKQYASFDWLKVVFTRKCRTRFFWLEKVTLGSLTDFLVFSIKCLDLSPMIHFNLGGHFEFCL